MFLISACSKAKVQKILLHGRIRDVLIQRSIVISPSVQKFLDDHVALARQLPSRLKNRKKLANQANQARQQHPSYDSQGHEESSNDDSNKKKTPEEEEEEKRKQLFDKMKRITAVSLFVYGLLVIFGPKNTDFAKISWSEFVNELLPTGQIHKIIVVSDDTAYLYLYNTGATNSKGEKLASVYQLGIPSIARFEAEVRAAENVIGLPPEQWTQIDVRRGENIVQWLQLLLIGTVIIGSALLYKKFKGGININDLMSKATKGKYKIIDPASEEGKKSLKIKFKDVAGCSEAKVEVREFVDYLRNPGRFLKLGAKLPRGALLTGPPGCGKTLLAKALAAESVVTFISMNGSEFVEMIGGLGAKRIRDLFSEARKRAPCIIYIDEIDAIGRKRSEGNNSMGGSSGEEEQTLNQLLVEMDGMGSGNGVVVLASTNRADVLDKALLRPGRFDRHIVIDLPTMIERKEMFDLYLKKIKLDRTTPVSTQRLAQMTPGFSGADIMNVANEAAIHAASAGKKKVVVADLDYALDRVIAGSEKRSRTLIEEEREIVAYHEAGHALVGWLLEHTDALLKVTIIPRTSAALGFAQYTPRDKKLFTQEELFDRMCMMLGGRCAENLKFGRITTGAQNDLEKVTKSAYSQVKVYGMSATVGPLSFPGTDGFYEKPYSKKLAAELDQEATSIVAQAHRATTKLLEENADKLESIAQALLKREVLNYEDVKKLIGAPTYGDKNLIDFVENTLPK